MRRSVDNYASLIFDCDGVVLNSNKIKTQAFYYAALPYGEAAAESLVEYHIANGGVSRYKKFAYFLKSIVTVNQDDLTLEDLLDRYASRVREGLLNCELARGLNDLRAQSPDALWLIVSGGDQEELREVFRQRGLTSLFNGGIFGSPDTKDEILARELRNGVIQRPALFLGDSKYDFEAATAAGLDFIFISGWSECKDWRDFIGDYEHAHIDDLDELVRINAP